MQQIFFGLFGGLGLFVFGMKHLSESLQKITGTRIRRALRSLMQNRFQGVAVGAIITSIVQSSSVTTVMLAGLLNAGIVNLSQSASVVIGANIGTTVTAQIIAFKVSAYALPAVGVGVAIMLFAKKKRTQFWGQLLFSCGLIFLGLSTMSGVMKPLGDAPGVLGFFASLKGHPVLIVVMGMVMTVVVQSSSAAIGLVLAMAASGLIDFQTSIFFILGNNIGTTITAWLASIGGSVSTRQMACFHTLFNVLGSLCFYPFILNGVYVKFIDQITPGAVGLDTIARHIANAHTLFNVINAGIFLALLTPLVWLTKWLVRGKDSYIATDVKYLQDSLLKTPEIAVDSTKKEMAAMASMVKETVSIALEGFLSKDKSGIPYVQTQEDAIDHLQHDVTFYITRLSQQPLSQELSAQIPPLLHSVNDLERVADHAINVTELTEKVVGDDLTFSNEAQADMRTMFAKLEDMFDATIRVIEFNDLAAIERVLLIEKMINQMYQDARSKHVKRLVKQRCEALSGMVFVDFLNNIEKMADHLTNISLAAKRGFMYDSPDGVHVAD